MLPGLLMHLSLRKFVLNVLDDLPCVWMLREWILERFSANSKIGATFLGYRWNEVSARFLRAEAISDNFVQGWVERHYEGAEIKSVSSKIEFWSRNEWMAQGWVPENRLKIPRHYFWGKKLDLWTLFQIKPNWFWRLHSMQNIVLFDRGENIQPRLS